MGGLLDPGSVRQLHQIFHLRIELELEVAAVLWRTAELVRAMADVGGALRRREAARARIRPQLELAGAPDDAAADRPDGIGHEWVRRAEAA